jgi:hypothetical protein
MENNESLEELQDSSDESDGKGELSDVDEERDTPTVSMGKKPKSKKTLHVAERVSLLLYIGNSVA